MKIECAFGRMAAAWSGEIDEPVEQFEAVELDDPERA
jgi:hypothetical protein